MSDTELPKTTILTQIERIEKAKADIIEEIAKKAPSIEIAENISISDIPDLIISIPTATETLGVLTSDLLEKGDTDGTIVIPGRYETIDMTIKITDIYPDVILGAEAASIVSSLEAI